MELNVSTSAARLFEAMPELVRALQHAVREVIHADGLTLPQYRVLNYLARHGTASVTELAEWRDVSLPAMSKMVSGLVDRQFVQRTDDPGCRRTACLDLTPTGEVLNQRITAQVEAWLVERLSHFGKERSQRVVDDLEQLIALLDQPATRTPLTQSKILAWNG